MNAELIDEPKYYYHQCSIARKIRKVQQVTPGSGKDEFSAFVDGKKTVAPKKFEVCVIYSSSNSKKLRVRKIKFGCYGDVERDSVTEEEFKKMRAKYDRILIDHEGFDKVTFDKTGSFFNPKFWDVNSQWTLSDSSVSQEELIKRIDEFLIEKCGKK